MRLARFLFILFTAVVLASCSQTPSVSEPEKIIKVGFMICNSEAETLERFRPLTAWMSKKLGVKMEAVAVDTFKFTREVDDMDFTHTNSLLYIILKRLHGVKVLTADKQG
ncbi:MAG: PhnD/SsuA/transferrin family substrate-binding protein, partial [Nitrospirota bacterium]